MTTRRLLVAAAALLPLSADAHKQRNRRRKRCRRCRCRPSIERQSMFCDRGTCDGEDPACGAHGCACLGTGPFGLCASVPESDAPPCNTPPCPHDALCLIHCTAPGGVLGACIETCGHPGETRCYELCL